MHEAVFAPRLSVTPVLRWWNSLDRVLLFSILTLLVIGVVLITAAGPVAVMRIGMDNPNHFIERQLLFLIPAVIVLIGSSMLSRVNVRRLGVMVALGSLVLMVGVALFAPSINGASRWISFAGFTLQPSEFFKPAFVIASAWLLSEGARDTSVPGGALSLGLYAIAAVSLLLQPDYGQLMLLTALWGVTFFVAGWNWTWIAGLGATALGVLAFGYNFAPHVRSRIDRFLSPSSGDTYQVDQAMEAISNGGLLGHDLNHMPGVKQHVPDAHTDFIFSVAGEEFGFVLCAVIIGIFATIALRSLFLASKSNSLFLRCAIVGLSAQLAFQAIINIGVSLSILPAKGMTLPFVSAGGSSLIASSLTAGFLLALTRSRLEQT